MPFSFYNTQPLCTGQDLCPALVRSPVLSAVSRGNPTLGTDHGTRLIRLILCRGFLPLQAPLKNGSAGAGMDAGAVSLLQLRKPHTGQWRWIQMSLFAPLVFTGSALSRSRAEISFPALRQAISRGKMTFGFSRILTQTLTHTGIRIHGTSGTDRARERGFPSRKGRKPAKMSLHRIQTAAHNPKVVGSSPASATMIS